MNDFTLLIEQYIWLFTLLAIWSIIWKGIALWKAARRDQMAWYIALLIVNTLGLLEIIYLIFFSKKKPESLVQ